MTTSDHEDSTVATLAVEATGATEKEERDDAAMHAILEVELMLGLALETNAKGTVSTDYNAVELARTLRGVLRRAENLLTIVRRHLQNDDELTAGEMESVLYG